MYEYLLIVSCHMGLNYNPKCIPSAPSVGTLEVFFVNDNSLLTHVRNKGWKAHSLAHRLPVSANYHQSSVQSKYVKFLQFLKNDTNKEYDNIQHIIYFDDKESVGPRHIHKLMHFVTKCDITIRFTPSRKDSIWKEVNAARGQFRYSNYMDKTIAYIHAQKNVSSRTMIANTGLIMYAKETATHLANTVYTAVMTLNQPECQIIWAVESQRYNGTICHLDFYHLGQPSRQSKRCEL